MTKRIGVIGSFVWDVIHGRDPRRLAGRGMGRHQLRAERSRRRAGRRLGDRPAHQGRRRSRRTRARSFSRTLARMLAPDARVIEVPYPNNRVELRYSRRRAAQRDPHRRRAGMELARAQAGARSRASSTRSTSTSSAAGSSTSRRRSSFASTSAVRSTATCTCSIWAVQPGGLRTLRPLPNVAEWCSLLRPSPGERRRDGDDGARSDGARRDGARARRAKPRRHARQARRRVLRAVGLRACIADLHRPRPLGASVGPVRTALVPREAHRRETATRPDAATCGARRTSLGCSRAMTSATPSSPRIAPRRGTSAIAAPRASPTISGRDQPHVTTVITVPPSLDDHSFEQVLEQVAPLPADAKILVDARHARWASPYGLTALLTLAQTRTERPAFAVPEHDDTASYWARAAFFHHAEALYDLHGIYPEAAGGRRVERAARHHADHKKRRCARRRRPRAGARAGRSSRTS